MSNENAKIDQNYRKTLLAVTDDAAQEVRRLLVDPTTGRLKCTAVVSAGGGLTSLNGLTAAVQTFAIGTTGTAPTWSSVTSVHTLNIPMASVAGVTAGLLSKTDYDIFNAKQPAGAYLTAVVADSPLSGSGTAGSHLVVDLSSKQAASSILTALAGLTYVSGSPLVRMTGAAAFSLDTATYLTSLSGAVLTSQVSPQTIGDTTNRLAKLWATDITVSNAILGSVTGNAGTVTNGIYTTSQVTALAATAAGDYNKYLHANAATGVLEWSAVASAGATTALDNLASVAINTSLLPGVTNSIDLGSTTKTFRDIYLTGTADPFYIKLHGTTPTGTQTITFPDRTLTIDNITTATTTNGTGFLKGNGTVISFDNSTYLTSVTAHNILSTTHGDTATGSVVRGDIMYGNATPKWDRLALPATPTGKVLQATATDVAWSTNPLTIGASASVSGSNTGDQTLASLGAQAQLNGTGFVKASGTTISYDNSTYLTSVTAHNLLSTTHGDTTAAACARGSLIVGDSNTKWVNLAFPATPTGKYLNATATDIAWSTYALSLAGTLTTAGAFSTAGAFGMTLTATNTTSVTLPVSGTLVSSVTTGNGVSAVNTAGALAFTLGAITPSTVNGLTLTSVATGFTIAGGTTSKTLTVPLDASVSGTNTGDQTLAGLGGATIALDNLVSVAMNASLQWNNTADRTFNIASTANTVVGRALTISAGSTVTGGTADMAGGDLSLNSGLGKGTGASSIHFSTGTTLTTGSTLQTLSEKMTILGNGNVGIGTTAPTYNLQVESTSTVQLGTYSNTGGSNLATIILKSDGIGVLNTIYSQKSPTSNTARALRFVIGGDEVMRLDTTGNVGIGTTAPTAYLHLKAGTATASTAPLKLTAGVLNTTPELGAIEFVDNGTTGHLYVVVNVAGVVTRLQII